MDLVYVKVKYGVNWDDCTYEGTQEIDIPLPRDGISIYNLRYNISHYYNLPGSDFDVICTKTTRSGRIVKSRLTKDEQLVELCNVGFTPTVFVKTKYGASSLHAGASSSYVPTFDPLQPYEGSLEGGDPFHHENVVLENTIPDLNQTVEDDDAHTDDEDYIPIPEESSETSESEGESNLYLGGRQMNRALFAEWTAWIHEEGGMQKLLGMMYPDLHGGEAVVGTDTEHMSNWFVPLVPARPRDSAVYHEDLLNIDELSPHSVFFSKEEIWIAAGLWHLNRRKEYKVSKSDTTRMLLKCKLSSDCPFRLYLISEGGPWTISIFHEEHTCSEFGLTNVHQRKVHVLVIGSIFAKRLLRDTQIIKPIIIQNELKSEFGIDATYDVCLKGRNAAIEMVYGKHKDSFNDLLGYLHMLRITNPETITEHEISPDGRFKQVFIALGAARFAWQNGYIRPIIVVDGTHLKGKAHGLMFVAVAKDANEQLFPLAYGIGPTEDHESWTWFMRGLQIAYGPLQGTLFVSDQHLSIIHAVQVVFPEARHGFCYYHLAKNLLIYGRNVGEQFQQAAYTYDHTEHTKFMIGIRATSRLAYNKLMKIGPEKWSRSMCPARRFSNMTSNAAESFNKSLLWARRLPICACLDAVRLIIAEWFNERRAKCRNDQHPITEEARRKLAVQLERSTSYKATQIDNAYYKVKTSKREVTVDLQRHVCECYRWQFDCLPCAHAIAAIRANRENVATYVSIFYRRTTYEACFSVPIHSVPKKHHWIVPECYRQLEVLPPVPKRLPGRPKESRIKGRGERGRRGRPRRRCLHCNELSHTGPTCPNLSG